MRIVAGKHRGMTLHEFEASNVRPTIDRVRENIFNKIQFGVPNSCVLDLFAGTGAVSLEFLSRGACKVVSVDNNRKSIDIIKKNFSRAQESGEIVQEDYLHALDLYKNTKFDYIFLDPPYDSDYGERAIFKIAELDILHAQGLIIYEHAIGKKFQLPQGYKVKDLRKYGSVEVSYIERNTYE